MNNCTLTNIACEILPEDSRLNHDYKQRVYTEQELLFITSNIQPGHFMHATLTQTQTQLKYQARPTEFR